MIYEYEITKSILLNNQDNEHMWLLFKKVKMYMEWIYLFLAIDFDKGESLYDINVKNKVSYIKVCVE